METENKDRLMSIQLSSYSSPAFLDSKNKEWVSYGKVNEFPYFLIDLMNNHPEHGAVVKGKAQYIFGKGLEFEDEGTIIERAKQDMWLYNANRYQTWNEVYKKTCFAYELYNGFAWEVIWNNGGTSFEVYNIEFGKLRRSKCGSKIFYCDAWMIDQNGVLVPNNHPEKHPSFKEFPMFNENIRTGSQIFYFKQDQPNVVINGDLYPLPIYNGAIKEIETDINISNLRYHYSNNGMFAQSLISFFNGDPSPQEKKMIKRMFDRTYTGSENSGQMIFSFNDKNGTAPTVQTLTQSDLDKVFADTRKECQDKIFSAHLTAPVLFGIKTEGSLSDTSGEATLKEWDKFMRTYIELRQEDILTQIKYMGSLLGVNTEDLCVKQTQPVGLELPNDPTIMALFDKATLQKYYAKKYGIEIEENELAPGQPQPVAQINEHLKKLSGRDWQHIKRMIREVNSGKTNRSVGSMMLKNAYGLSDEDINTLFSTPENQFRKFTKEEQEQDLIISLFAENCVDDNDDEVVSEKFIDFHDHKFATAEENQNSVLEMLKGNPLATPESMAKQLGITPEEVMLIVTGLVSAGLLLNTGTAYEPTQKAIKKDTVLEVETYKVYKYVTRDDVPDAKQTRAFCSNLLALTAMGKRWTKEGIDNIKATANQKLAMPDFDPWVYRGGFYTNPKDSRTTPYCRHIWKEVTKTRRKK